MLKRGTRGGTDKTKQRVFSDCGASRAGPATHSARGQVMTQTWEERVEDYVYSTRDRLDEFALRHIAVGAEPLLTATLLTLTADEIDYLYARIASILEMGLIRAGGPE
jgi:hypothetical protein